MAMVNYSDRFKNMMPETVQLAKELIGPKGGTIYRLANRAAEAKFADFAVKARQLYGIDRPEPRVMIKPHDVLARAVRGYYNPTENLIVLPKISVITFLHEFAHYMQSARGQSGEGYARAWSMSLFKLAAPKLHAKAVRNGMALFA